MQHKDIPWSERMFERERLRRLNKMDRPDPFLDKVFEVTLLGTVGVMLGMAAIGSQLGQ